MEEPSGSIVQETERSRVYGDGKWVRCFQAPEGGIYLHGNNKSVDRGMTVVSHDDCNVDEITASPEGAMLFRPGLFIALDGATDYCSPGVYSVRLWRSADNLKTIEGGQSIVRVPEGPNRQRKQGEWFGLYFYRNILEMGDGTLLATMEGNFEHDTIVPVDRHSKLETPYKIRSFVVISRDQGRSWDYLSTVACPEPEDPVGEGFGEPSAVQLDNGELLCVMRSGHYSPLYACRSKDAGRNWTDPVYTGLERGCDPCLLKLSDGRLALSYGKRYPEGWSRITPEGDHARWEYPGEGLVKLAISADGLGETWTEAIVGRRMGSCYSTIVEAEPNVVFCQVDGWYWRGLLSGC